MSCKNCGRQNPSGSLYCQDCGQRLGDWVPAERPGAMATPPTGLVRDAPPATITCSRCGTSNAAHMRFCNNCGMGLASGPLSPVSAAQQSGTVPAVASLSSGGSASQHQPAGSQHQQPGSHGQPAFPQGGLQPQLPLSAPGSPHGRPQQPPAGSGPDYPGVTSGLQRGPQMCWRCRAEGDAGADFCKFCGARYADDPAASISAATPGAGMPNPPSAPHYANGAPRDFGAPAAPGAMTGPVDGSIRPGASEPSHAGDRSGPHMPAVPEEDTSVGNFRAEGGRAPTHMDGSRVDSGEHGLNPRALLVAILKDGSDGRIYAIHDEQTDLGRLEGHIVLADDPYLSPRHVRILLKGDALIVRDLDSLNGVYVRVREPSDLQDGDMLLLGQQVMRFEVLPELELPLGPATHRGVMVFGTPEVPRMARLIQYTTEGVGRDVHYLYRDETVVGREQGDIVCTDDPFMSRRHAAITLDRSNRRYVLRDLGSSNGTAVRIRGERSLRPGDQFRVGRHLFRYDKPQTRNDGAGGRSGA